MWPCSVLLVSDNKMDVDLLLAKVHKLEARKHVWSSNGVRKSMSPYLPVILGNATTDAIIDEGSEINCLDEGFAVRISVKYVPTKCKAIAAGSTSMQLAGQTTEDISINIKHTGKPIKWRLGKLVVVKNLWVDILVGEPAKVDNEIVTIPHERLVEMGNIAGKRLKLPYS